MSNMPGDIADPELGVDYNKPPEPQPENEPDEPTMINDDEEED